MIFGILYCYERQHALRPATLPEWVETQLLSIREGKVIEHSSGQGCLQEFPAVRCIHIDDPDRGDQYSTLGDYFAGHVGRPLHIGLRWDGRRFVDERGEPWFDMAPPPG